MSRILVVANRTLGSSDLLQSIRDRMTKGPCEFTLLVPATPRWNSEPASRLAGGLARGSEAVGSSQDSDDNYEFARSRLQYGLEVLRGLGATVDGEVGARLLRALPSALVLHRAEWDSPVAALLVAELGRDEPGRYRQKRPALAIDQFLLRLIDIEDGWSQRER